MSLSNNFPTVPPSFSISCTNVKNLDSRVTVTRALNTATYTDYTGIIRTALANTPRFDYNPASLSLRGLLIEEARTNLILQSSTFTDAVWTKTSISVGSPITSPDGTANMLLATGSGGSAGYFYPATAITVAASTSYTISCFVKAGSATGSLVRIYDDTLTTRIGDVEINWSGGVPTLSASTYTSSSITNVGGGIYRFVGTFSTGAFTAIKPLFYADITNGTNTTYFWGVQLEAGAFATSYIPTTTTVLTRNADVASITGTNFSNWFNASAGSFVTDVADSLGTTPRSMSVYGASSNEQLSIGFDITRVRSGGVDIGSFYSNQSITGKRAVAYATNEQAAAKDGAALSSTNTGLPSGLASLWIGQTNTGSAILNGHIRRITYYPTRLTNTLLQTLTSS